MGSTRVRRSARGLAVAGLLLGALTGRAASPPDVRPLAQLRVDVDADGREEDVVLDAAGRLTVGTTGATTPPLVLAGPAVTLRAPAAIAFARDGNHGLVVVTAATSERGAAGPTWGAIVRAGARPELVWSSALGPQGRDGEWSRRIAVEGGAVLLLDERPGVGRCDEPRPGLHPRRFVLGPPPAFRPVSIAPVAAAGSSVIVAHRDPPAGAEGRRPLVFRVEAASSARDDGGSAEGLARPRELDDGDPTTGWQEGRGGWGRGEFVTARARTRTGRVAAIGILPGDGASASAFAAANRLKRVHVVLDDRTIVVELPRELATGAPRMAWVTLPAPIASRCLSVVVAEVWPGQDADRTVIGELAVLTDGELAGERGLAALADEIAIGGPSAASAEGILVDAGAAGAQALRTRLAAAGGGGDASLRRRLAVALAQAGDPASAPDLVRALAELPSEATGDREAIGHGLARIGSPAVAPLVGLLGDDAQPLPARVAAAGALGEVPDPSARDALATAAGAGPRGLRRAVGDALAHRPPADRPGLLEAARAAGATPRGAAILRALVRALERAADGPLIDEPLRAAVMAEAARIASDATATLDVRVVAADALGRGAVTPEDATTIRGLLEAGDAPEPRVAVIAALPPRAEGPTSTLHAAALADRDPGVRGAALGAGGEALVTAAATALHSMLLRDHWPHLRAEVARRLEGRCDLATRGVLWAAGERDPVPTVRLSAFGSLVACKDPGVGARLLVVVGDRQAVVPFRTGAAKLLGRLGDVRITPALSGLLGRLRTEALATPSIESVPIAVARSLGHMGGAAAERTLAEAVDDPGSPGVQAAAIEAYAVQCPTGAATRIARAAEGASPIVTRAARVAGATCTR